MKAKTLFGLLLSFSLFFSGCGNSNSGKIEFDKSKDYKPDEVKKIVFHDKQTDDLLKLVSKKLSPEEAAKFKRSILLTHRRFGAKAEGKTIGELFDLKLTREEVLKIKFDPNNYEAAYDAVELSELTDKEKKAFEVCVRGYDPRKWAGKTIGEMLGQREADKKVEQSEKKQPATSTPQSSNSSSFLGGVKKIAAAELFNGFYLNGTIKNQYMGKTVEFSSKVSEKFITNDGVPVIIVYNFSEKNRKLPYDDAHHINDHNAEFIDYVVVKVNNVQEMNRIPEGAFITVTGTVNNMNQGKPRLRGVVPNKRKKADLLTDEDIFTKEMGDRCVFIEAKKLVY